MSADHFTGPEIALLVTVLRPRVEALAELHAAQVQALPPGDDSWADTEEALELCSGALRKLEAA
jgi:hypothetical protein